MRNHMKSKHKSTEERHMRMQLLREGLACEAKTMRRCIITSTIKARSWATSRPVCPFWADAVPGQWDSGCLWSLVQFENGTNKPLLIPEVAWVHTCLIFEKTRISHATKSHPGLEPKGEDMLCYIAVGYLDSYTLRTAFQLFQVNHLSSKCCGQWLYQV